MVTVITLPRRLGTLFLTFVILPDVTGNLRKVIVIIKFFTSGLWGKLRDFIAVGFVEEIPFL